MQRISGNDASAEAQIPANSLNVCPRLPRQLRAVTIALKNLGSNVPKKFRDERAVSAVSSILAFGADRQVLAVVFGSERKVSVHRNQASLPEVCP